MRILLLLAHSIAEHDDLRMLHELGHDVFSIGAYIDPARPHVDARPALPQVPSHPELAALVGDQMAAKEHLPEAIIDWADAIIVHHYPAQWVYRQWDRIRHKRVIWRTCGQSDVPLERIMGGLRRQGLQIVRYSPAEQVYFERQGEFAGVDALIRFGKEPSEWYGWTGSEPYVANITQDMRGRGEWCGLSWYLAATEGLDARPGGQNSEALAGGLGTLSYDGMREYLRRARAYVYTGTHPASYTLGLIEALMTGVPVVSIGEQAWMGPWDLFEGADLSEYRQDDPALARLALDDFLRNPEMAQVVSARQRARAIETFGMDGVKAQWAAFLGTTASPCAFGDPACPCQDGDPCHYVDDPETGTKAMTPPGVPV